jgi:putative membrane protein insertion efficiency factor
MIRWIRAQSQEDPTRDETDYLARTGLERPELALPTSLSAQQRALVALLLLYQRRLSGRLARTCIFEPSCSDYAILTIAHNGVLRGSYDALRRWVRCRPRSDGGIDYPRGCDVPH